MKQNRLTKIQIQQIIDLFNDGHNRFHIAKSLNINWKQVDYWSKKQIAPISQQAEDIDLKSIECRFESDWGYHYAHLLGLYLGDGYINLQHERYGVYKLRITTHMDDNIVIKDCVDSINVIFPNNKVAQTKNKNAKCIDVYVYSRNIGFLFPQIGAGRKHTRSIILNEWQRKVVTIHPTGLIRGLMQSDGSRYTQRVGKYSYIKYTFCNVSSDIVDILEQYSKLVNLNPTRNIIKPQGANPNPRNVLCFYKQADVDILEHIVGNKRTQSTSNRLVGGSSPT